MPRHDYKYLQLILGREKRRAWMSDLATLRTRKLHSLANTFALNTARASALSVALAEVAYQVRRDQWCVDYSVFKTEKTVRKPFEVFTPSRAVKDEFSRQLEQLLNLSEEKKSRLIANWGAGAIKNMLRFSVGMDTSLEALLSSIVVEAWIAFETLASDLWVRAVDLSPTLRKRVNARTPRADRSDLQLPEQLQIDPARRFGSSLREARKVSFQRLPYIVRNYEIAFGAKIKSAFKADNSYIYALSAFRNAIIHNGGRADAEFVKRVADFKEFALIKPKQKLKLDGDLVARLRTSAATVGANLLHFADDILTPP
jgi:hypothetical protein